MINYAELLGTGGLPNYTPVSATTGVTMALGAYSGGPQNTGLTIGFNDPLISFFGGSVAPWGTTFPRYLFEKTYNLTFTSGGREGLQGVVAFETNATSFDIRLYCVGASSYFTLLVDGKEVRDASVFTPSDGSLRYVTVDVSNAGLSPGYHSFEFNFVGGANFGGLVLNPGASVRPLSDSGPRMVFLGDSFTEGNGAANTAEDFPSIVGHRLGIPDIWQSAFGGTGYARALNDRPALVDRIQQDGVNANGDIYIIAMGTNDAPGVYDSVVQTLTALTQGQPNARIFVVGAWNIQGPGTQLNAGVNAEIEAAAALFPNIVFLDASALSFTKHDPTHPDVAGQWKIGDWLTAQINASLGIDGLIEQGVAGDVVGPVFLDGFDRTETYQFTVLENGAPSTRFELVPTGDAFPILKLKDGVAISVVEQISVTLHVTGSLGTNYTTSVNFVVRSHVAGTDGNDNLAAAPSGAAIFLDGGAGDDQLTGGAGIDRLVGGDGADELNGGAGDDTLAGGAGSDTYHVDSIADILIELPNQGFDTLFTSINGYMLADNFEGLNLTGAAISGGGNDADNFLGGNGLANFLYGHGGNDRIEGGAGADNLYGESGNDVLDGGTEQDSLFGGVGDDSFIVDRQDDFAIEKVGEGVDTVESSASYYLYANIENLTLTGSAGNFGVGNGLANLIIGNAGENLLIAGAGNDEVHGGAARDAIFGQDGADNLFGDGGIDYIVAGTGNDTIDGGADADEIYGQEGDDTIFGGTSFDTDIIVGGDGNDTIHGNSGAGDFDYLYGNLGDDTFYVDTPADLVFEQGGEGTDTVYAGINGGGFYLYDNIENLILTGNTPFGVGNALDNSLTGNAIGNYLLGGLGNDTLNGMGGGDVLFGEAGNDTFVFGIGTGGDVIGDFTQGQDKIDISAFGFSFAQAQANFIQNGNVGAINLGNGDFIVLHNVTMANLNATDFILGGANQAALKGSAPVMELADSWGQDTLHASFALSDWMPMQSEAII